VLTFISNAAAKCFLEFMALILAIFFFFGGEYNLKTKVNKDLEKFFAGSNYLIITYTTYSTYLSEAPPRKFGYHVAIRATERPSACSDSGGGGEDS